MGVTDLQHRAWPHHPRCSKVFRAESRIGMHRSASFAFCSYPLVSPAGRDSLVPFGRCPVSVKSPDTTANVLADQPTGQGNRNCFVDLGRRRIRSNVPSPHEPPERIRYSSGSGDFARTTAMRHWGLPRRGVNGHKCKIFSVANPPLQPWSVH